MAFFMPVAWRSEEVYTLRDTCFPARCSLGKITVLFGLSPSLEPSRSCSNLTTGFKVSPSVPRPCRMESRKSLRDAQSIRALSAQHESTALDYLGALCNHTQV